MWTGGGNTLTRKDGVEVRLEGDRTYGRIIGGEWQEMDNFSNAFAPGNDLMAYLAGAKNVRELGTETRTLPSSDVASDSQPTDLPTYQFTKYAFDVDGPAFASHMRDQLERQLREKGELPLGLTLDSSAVYRGATGQGEVWIDSHGLPLRLSVHLVYPPERSGEQVEADIRTDFSHFAPMEVARNQVFGKNLVSSLGLPHTAGDWQRAGGQAVLATACLGLLLLLIIYRKSKKVYAATAVAVIVSMVVTPLLQSHQAAGFMERQAAKQAEVEQRQEAQEAAREAQETLTSSDWDPHHDPLGNSDPGLRNDESAIQNPQSAIASQLSLSSPGLPQFPQLLPSSFGLLQQAGSSILLTCTEEEKNTDTDQDGLTDCDEKEEYDTNPTKKDTDGDGLQDG